MGEGRFRVEPEALDTAGAAFTEEAGELANKIQGFSAQARNAGEAFGALTEAKGLLADYENLAQNTIQSLHKLQKVVETTGGKLSQTANNYRTAESDATMDGGA